VATAEKAPGALVTIGELSQDLGVAQHILRYWETKFPQLKPMQRAGNRRYYRAADVDLARRIHRLLNEEGYTVRGVQKLLRDKPGGAERPAIGGIPIPPREPHSTTQPDDQDPQREEPVGVDVFRLIALRNRLADALEN
jgi:DNA-binding transcriptional MerR regulator